MWMIIQPGPVIDVTNVTAHVLRAVWCVSTLYFDIWYDFTVVKLKQSNIYGVYKNVLPLSCCNFDTHEPILITWAVSDQKMFYFNTLLSYCFCTIPC